MTPAFEAVRRLPSDILASTAKALRQGVLQASATSRSIRWMLPDISGPVAEALASLLKGGADPLLLVQCLEAIAAERHEARCGLAIELVLTGPDTTGLVRNTSTVTEELFGSARSSVHVVGFAIAKGRAIFEQLARRMDADDALEVTCCFDVRRPPGNQSPDHAITAKFLKGFREYQWPGRRLPKLYHDPRSLAIQPEQRSVLHAKCVAVDRKRSLITSANFTA